MAACLKHGATASRSFKIQNTSLGSGQADAVYLSAWCLKSAHHAMHAVLFFSCNRILQCPICVNLQSKTNAQVEWQLQQQS